MSPANWIFWAVVGGQMALVTLGFLIGFRYAMNYWLRANRDQTALEYRDQIYFVDCVKPRLRADRAGTPVLG